MRPNHNGGKGEAHHRYLTGKVYPAESFSWLRNHMRNAHKQLLSILSKQTLLAFEESLTNVAIAISISSTLCQTEQP